MHVHIAYLNAQTVMKWICLSICERNIRLTDLFPLGIIAFTRPFLFGSWQIKKLEHLGSPLGCCVATPLRPNVELKWN